MKSKEALRGKIYSFIVAHNTAKSGGGFDKKYRVIFLTGPPLKISLDWPPPNLLGLAPPPKFPKCLNHIHFARHLDLFQS